MDGISLSYVLTAVGAATIAAYFFRVLRASMGALRAFGMPSTADFKSMGQWAVVTGATEGIGRAYAEQLAERGMDVVLISRTAQKLDEVATAIRTAYGVRTKIVMADFTRGPELYPGIERQLAGLDIGILVNNVGMTSDIPEYFHLVPNRPEIYMAMINCNDLSVTAMTGIILPRMLAKQKGIIINISSMARLFITPFFSVYTATKGYVTTFTRTLQAEYASQGVLIQLVEPMYVTATKMNKLKRPSFFAPTATAFVRAAIGSMGVLNDTTGCFAHWLESNLACLLPEWVRNAVVWRMMLQERTAALNHAAAAADHS